MITLLWKPYGITSIQFLKEYQKKINCSKATCVGRLDPLAQGILRILTDNDTKDMKKYLTSNKLYSFDMILGVETESHDCLSKIVEVSSSEKLKQMDSRFIIAKIHEFIARYNKQKFPLVSSFVTTHNSLKKPLWWFYMNGYRDIPLPEKNISIKHYNVISVKKEKTKILSQNFINRIDKIKDNTLQQNLNTENTLVQWKKFKDNFDKEFIVVSMELNVSSGFYVRRFCHDFGKFIGINGIAFDITRTKIEERE